jgi:hypothetical protein
MWCEVLTWQNQPMHQTKVQGHESWSQSVLLIVTLKSAWILMADILIACNMTVGMGGVILLYITLLFLYIILLNFFHPLHYHQTFTGNIVWVEVRREEGTDCTETKKRYITLFRYHSPEQPRGLVVRVSVYWSWGPRFDSHGDHGLGSLVELRFKAPPGTSYSYITNHLFRTM